MTVVFACSQGCLTELRPDGRLVIRKAPDNVEDMLVEVAQERHGAENVKEVAAEGVHTFPLNN